MIDCIVESSLAIRYPYTRDIVPHQRSLPPDFEVPESAHKRAARCRTICCADCYIGCTFARCTVRSGADSCRVIPVCYCTLTIRKSKINCIGSHRRSRKKNGSLCCTVAKPLSKLSPELTGKEVDLANEFLALG